MNDETREKLAALEHEQWAHWTRYMLDTLRPILDNTTTPCAAHTRHRSARVYACKAIERWLRQIDTPYAELSEAEKASDRAWADKVIEVLSEA